MPSSSNQSSKDQQSPSTETVVCGVKHLQQCLKDIGHDQAGIWTSPLRLAPRDAIWLLPFAGATGVALHYDAQAQQELGCTLSAEGDRRDGASGNAGAGETITKRICGKYSSPGGTVVFDFRLGRGRDGPNRFLRQFEGILQTDGYAAYDQIGEPRMVHAAWAHAKKAVLRGDAVKSPRPGSNSIVEKQHIFP